ncbi:MAG: M28 family peptidase [Candidatus Eiseniibacteriota bacterium]
MFASLPSSKALRRAVPMLAAVAVAMIGATPVGTTPTATTTEGGADSTFARWFTNFQYLASDAMRGRQTGSPEHRRAAEYVAEQFRTLGLEPGAAGSYLQPVSFVTRRVRESECSLELVFPNRTERLELGRDATLQMSIDAPEQIEARAVFAGYGISVPDQGYDDVAKANLKGRIAVFIQGAPESVTEPRRSHAQSSAERWARLREAGAIGMTQIRNPRHSDLNWERAAAQRFTPGMSLADPEVDERGGQQVAISWNPAHAQRLFDGAPHTFDALLTMADSGSALPSFDLAPKVRARVHYDREVVESQNVVAVLPAATNPLSRENVVLTGHLDHLGVGAPVAGDSINNGAMDNASGIAELIEVARKLKEGPPLRRSVVFAFVTGEEKGLLGSYYYTRRPTVPAPSIVANVNVDMVLPIVPFVHVVVHGVGESSLGDLARRVATETGVDVIPDPQPDRNLFIRSDQYNFIRAGIPALAFSAGAVPGSPQDSTLRKWTRERYHRPSDDLDQPFDREAPVRIIHFVTRLTTEIANTASRPTWKNTSFFRRYAESIP